MILTDPDITNVLKGIESAPPSANTGNAAFQVVRNVLQFPSTQKLSVAEILAKLDDMTIPQPILDQARPIFDREGFSVRTANIYYSPGRKTFLYTEAIRDEFRLALLHVPPDLFDTPDLFGSFGLFIRDINGVVRFIAQGRTDTTPGFNTYLTQQRAKTWYFVSWNWFLGFLAGTESIEQVFVLPETAQAGSLGIGDLTDQDRKKIVEVLAGHAAQPGGLSSKPTFENLIIAAGWPNKFSTKMNWTNQPDADAQFLVQFAIVQERFASGEARFGDTYLGALLLSVLPNLGSTASQEIAGLVRRYKLVSRLDSLTELRNYLS